MSLKNVLLILLFYHSTFLECIIFGFLIYNDSFYKILDIVCKKFFIVKNPCHNYWHCVIARVVSNLINTSGINTAFFHFWRLPAEEDDPQQVMCDTVLGSTRSAYEKLRQRAVVLKVARDQGWHVARELSSLQDQEEDPLLKKAIKNPSRR